jgi:hypothetical protein
MIRFWRMAGAAPTLSVLVNAYRAERRAFRAGLLEFLLVGGATLLLLPLVSCVRYAAGLDAGELAVGFLAFHAAYVINDPHFAVTYLLFYRDVKNRAFGKSFEPAQRARYLIAGFGVPVALAAWGIAGIATGSARTLGFLFELMFLLVGWHYVKQGFGVLSVLSARRGVRFSPLERKVVLAHCYAGWAYAWANPASASKLVEEKGVVYTALAHPRAVELVALSIVVLSAFALIGVFWLKLRRERGLPVVPLAGFLITVWLLTVYSSLDPLMVYLIPALHSVQYLYFVWLLKRNEARDREGPPSFGRPAGLQLGVLAATAIGLGWVLFHGAPEFLDGIFVLRNPNAGEMALGATPHFAVLFAFVNIHHYFMDTVIWRRENPETRYLLVR